MSSSVSESAEQILDRFEDAWNGPKPPCIEDFAPSPDSSAYLPVLVELVKIDMERRCRRGEQLGADEYRLRFPACGDDLAGWLDEARAAGQRAASPLEDTDDPPISPTLDGPTIPAPTSIPFRLLGEYEVLERLGFGGMGEVYKARHRRLDKLVALKMLAAGSQSTREAAARFQREMKAIGALDHPNVVEAHDAGEQSGVVYLAMKLIDGDDLERLVKQRGPLPIVEACELIRQAALGLHYLHERGLVHRDVKPSNLMRTTNGTVKVLDLGLARWCVDAEVGHGLTGTGRVMGTPDFLAPEQIENAADADARADLYGLGGTLFYLLTNRTPFADHKSLYCKLEAHRSASPPDVRSLRPDVPAELAEVLHRLLAKKPEERPQTAAEVATALAAFAGGPPPPTKSEGSTSEPSVAEPLPESEPPTEQPRKPRWLWYAAAAGMALAGLLLFFSFGRPTARPLSLPEQREENPPEPIHIMTLDVKLTRNVNGRGLPAGRLGVDAFDPHLGDTVTVEARLTRPAYAFLIAFRPDGTPEVCFPEKDDERPPLTDRPRYPVNPASEEEYGLSDGTGLTAFAVVVSSQPLPTFKDWWSRCQDCPWTKEEAPPGVVYRANGEDEVVAMDMDSSRGKGAKVKGKAPVARLAAWLRKTPEVEIVQEFGFVVEPRK